MDGPLPIRNGGWHTAGLLMRLLCRHYLTHVASLASPGLDELRWVKPVRPGDQLSVRVTVLKAAPSKSKPDREAAEWCLLGCLRIDVKTLRIEPFCESNDLVRLDRDCAEGVNVTLDVVLEVAIIDGCENAMSGLEPEPSGNLKMV